MFTVVYTHNVFGIQHWFLALGFHLKFSITLEQFHISHYVGSRRGKEVKRAKESVMFGRLTGLLRVSFFYFTQWLRALKG